MYLVVITDESFKFHTAATFDTIEALQAARVWFSPARGYSTLLFKLNPETEIYEEVYPEVLDNEQF